ncbi:hypothetical protein GA0070616_2142 [Micromonospora nigra]|uniref:Uncharacterized protein n=1 Tax=Micromonospora nigra TaxID=145857 RepID=A0A1C6RV12_9ACTN|nr:hypothetical protein [Micromonospora nigra]SCL20922.1 hypothetical protein GA0070616_2142 [Micromonospora nigra]
MRLTVGPLPPAVYWRRRAVVLGAGLLFLIVLLYSCNGPDPDRDAKDGQPNSGASGGTTPEATGSALTPQTGLPVPGGSAEPGTDPSVEPSLTDNPPAPVAPVADAGACADAELTVTAVPLPATVVRGAPVDLKLRIRNRAERTCSRDVGADEQELFIKSGAEKVWSSDTCGTANGSDVQSFTAGFERSYQVTWNGRASTRCADGVANGPTPPAGSYEVFARVGTKLSAPVKLTLTG